MSAVIRRPFGTVLAFLAALLAGPLITAAQAGERTLFPGSVREVSAAPSGTKHAASITRTALAASETAATLSFEVALRMRNFDEMQARIARGELISDSEKVARYFPLAADHDRVVQWLKQQGLEVTRTDRDRLGIFGRGTVAAVASAFQASFARVAVDGAEYTSAITPPSLPSDISAAVLGIHGLQPHIRRRPLSVPRSLHPNFTINSGYMPADIEKAYNANGVSQTGAGQTIAVYAFGYPQNSDLTAFWSAAGVSQSLSNIQTVDIAGGPGADPGDGNLEEASLDVEWASALAPGAAIRIYGANQNDPANNDEILQQVYADVPSQPNMHILNICIGGNELEVPHDYLIIEAQYMANLASAGVTVLSASGDTGATADNVLQTTYPTSDPDVTGVGGTTLMLGANDTVTSETAWSGSGGGISQAFSRPAWQTGPGVPAGTMRCVPDVAASADPNDGATIYYNGNALVIGGTSWATPVWAGFCALINQKRGTPLGLLNPKIYPLNPANGTSSAFRDITSGSNGTYNAGPGYDLCTGLGVPDVAALLAASSSLTSSPAANVPAQTGNQVVTTGQLATFFVVGEGSSPLAYQWQRMPSGSTTWSNLSNTGTYAGTTTPMMTVAGTTAAMTGDQFQCIVSNGSGTATSQPVSLTVNQVGVTTLAGWPGSSGSANGTGSAARFSEAGGLKADNQGNLYVADGGNYTIRKVTTSGVVTTVAGTPGTSGSTDGPVASALFSGSGGVAVDSAGNLYVADSGNYTIRKISNGVVSTLAGVAGKQGEEDGTGSGALFYDPENIAVDSAGNLYVPDGMGNVVRKVTPSGVVTTFAGSGVAGSSDGTGVGAEFNDPTGIALDLSGNVYVADYGNDTIRKITPSGVVTTMAGSPGQAGSSDGTGSSASFNGPTGVGVDSSGNVYVTDSVNDTIRMVNQTGYVTTVAGAVGVAENIDGLSSNARFSGSGDVAVDYTGVVYVADSGNSTIRRIIPGIGSAPSFALPPQNQTVNLGSSTLFTMSIVGTAPFSYQWYYNGTAIAGATNPFYSIADTQASDAGSYSVAVSNMDGSATSAAATLTVSIPTGSPDITAQPVGGALTAGGDTLSVTVSGSGPFTYQWYLNGSAIAGATSATYTATSPGSYTVAVTNAIATVESQAAIVGTTNRLVNISSRSIVETDGDIAIAGFAITGAPGATKQVLIRGVGPTLSSFNVSGVLAQPTITLFNSSGTQIQSNTGWGTGTNPSQVASVAAQVGAFALPAGSADSAMLASLSPGTYTVQLSGVGGTTGVGLVEVYEANTSDPSVLTNISTRADVGTGSNVLIAGFVVEGTQPATVLIRGVGPALQEFSVSGFLQQPTLTIYDSSNTQIETNTGWSTATNAAAVASAAASVGAFALPSGSADCALLMTLNPGSYTAEVSGVGGTSGIALIEVYQVPP